MVSDLHLIHLAVEAILAALVWLLARRTRAFQVQLTALEAGRGLLEKKFEGLAAVLDSRPIEVGRRRPFSLAPPEVSFTPERARGGKPAGLGSGRRQLSRGELELLLKVRGLSQSRAFSGGQRALPQAIP